MFMKKILFGVGLTIFLVIGVFSFQQKESLLGVASVITAPQGGTGLSSYTRGDIIFATSTNRLEKLAAGSGGQVVQMFNGVPRWQSDLFVSSTLLVDSTSTFYGSIMASGTTGGTPGSGDGVRLMWIPSKGAFRAGLAVGTDWDNSNIGLYSFAAGESVKASGDNSIAFPYYNIASGARCAALGSGSSCAAADSTALGQNNSIPATAVRATVVGSANAAYGSDNVIVGKLMGTEGVGTIGIGYGGYNGGNYSALIALNPLVQPSEKNVYLPNTFSVLGGNSTFGSNTLNSHVLNVSATTTSGGIALLKGIASQTGNYLEVQNSAGNSQFIINSSGQVGIGTSTPKSILHVEDSTQATSTLWVGSLSRPGITCFGDADGSGATCAYYNNGVAYYYSTSTY